MIQLERAWVKVERLLVDVPGMDRSERGASLVEYTLLVSLVVLLALGALEVFGGVTAGKISSTAELFPD